MKERKEKVDTSQRLSVEDFQNPMFDRQEIRLRTIDPHKHAREQLVSSYAEELDDMDRDLGMGASHEISMDVAEDMLADELEPLREGKYQVIEGATFTDGFNMVGFTYDLRDSSIKILNTDNQILFEGFIYTSEEYEKSLKKADQKQRRLDDKKFKS